MGQPAARMTDMHVCPFVTPVVPPVPHVGGPIIGPCMPNVLVGGLPAARVTDMASCAGPPDTIVAGAYTVLIGSLPAARMGDQTAHGGSIVMGLPTVLIGMSSSGGAGGAGAAGPAGAAAGAGEAGAAGKSGHTTRSPSGLGKDVDKLAQKSPTLENNIDQLKKDGWTIKYGPAGKGSFTDRPGKTIVIDSNEKGHPEQVVQTLAHESGHARYTPDPYVPPKGLTRDQYVKRNVDRDLKDEGEATMTNAQVRQEIKDNGGPDIGIAGAQEKKYEQIAAKYPDPKDRDKAREEIGQVFAKGEHPSTDPSKDYEDYYAKTYQDYWDKHVAKKKP